MCRNRKNQLHNDSRTIRSNIVLLTCITHNTLIGVDKISIRELRNNGGKIIDRISHGSILTITRSGKEVAEIHPLAVSGLSAETLVSHWRLLPEIDARDLRADIDKHSNSSL